MCVCACAFCRPALEVYAAAEGAKERVFAVGARRYLVPSSPPPPFSPLLATVAVIHRGPDAWLALRCVASRLPLATIRRRTDVVLA